MGAGFSFGTVLMVAFVLASVCYLFLIVSTYMYDSRTKTRRDYMIAGISLFCFSFFYGFMTIADIQISLRILWAIGFFSGCMFVPVWLIFISNLIKLKHKHIKSLLHIAAVISALICLLCIFFGGTSFRATEFGSQFSYQNNLLFNILFMYIIILSGALLMMHIIWFRQTNLKRHRRQVLLFIIISTLTLPFLFTTDFIIPIYTNYTVTPLGALAILPPSFFVFYSLRRYKLFGITVSNVSQYTFTSVKMPIYVLDSKDYIIIENNAAVDCLGESAIGKGISECFLVDGKSPDEAFFKDDFAGETVHLKAISSTRICEMSLTIEKDNYNDAICKIVVFTDMTAIKEMEESSAVALYEALEANKVKSDFLAKMSHEIRTPMNAIIGMTELVLREKTSITVRENTTTIKQASENLLSIINDLLDFSKIETGNINVENEQYSLSSLIDDVINIIKIRLSFSGVRFIVDLDEDLPNFLIGDETRIRQSLINVLGNAVKYTERGHITLTVESEPIDDDSLVLVMTVKDTGSGIKQDDLGNLFTEYYQVRSSSDGVGLGLPITYGFVMAMNGEITVESEYGKGSTFVIKVPQQIGNPKLQTVFDSPRGEGGDTIFFNRRSVFTAPDARILVVDDIKTNLRVICGLLASYKMIVDSCLSGKEAIEAVKSSQYDLVFMDYRMPEMDGLEATERIRSLDNSNAYYSTLPIIALTADAISGRREMLMDSGFNDYISKPINNDDLNSILEKWIPKHKQAAPVVVRTEAVEDPDPDPDPDTMLQTIGGLDIKKGIRMSGGKVDYYYETLASFHEDALERLDLFKEYFTGKNLDKYITIVHAVKSATANIGADSVSLLAAGLENAGLCKDWLYIENNNGIFLNALEDLMVHIKAALDSHDRDCAAHESENDSEIDTDIHRELATLRSALDEMDIVTTNNAVDALLKLARSEDEKKIIRDISHHILLFEYDKACTLIECILP